MPAKSGLRGSQATVSAQAVPPVPAVASAAPVVILSYGYSGAALVQQILAEGTDLACTAATGIVPLCRAAAAAWAQIELRPDTSMSRLAISSIRTLVSTQITIVLAAADKRRWCELATSAPSAAQTFLQIFPEARFVCVHRACTDVISAAIRAQSRGLNGPLTYQFTRRYPGNSTAAVAAYWSWATEQMLAFEAANPHACRRVHYEDVIADAEHALASIRTSLHLNQPTRQHPPEIPERAEPAGEDQKGRHLPVALNMIPAELRRQIGQLHAELGYPQP